MIVEMAGRPAAHLTVSLEKHIGVLKQVTDIETHSIKVSVPQEIPAPEGKTVSKDEVMFSAFAEADIETESFARLTQTMFDFMPSSVEVIEPSKITMDFTDATDLLNNISGRLHRYDEFAKIAGQKMQHMNAQLIKAKEILDAKNIEIAELKKGIKKKTPAKKAVEKKPTKKKTVKKKSEKKKPVSKI